MLLFKWDYEMILENKKSFVTKRYLFYHKENKKRKHGGDKLMRKILILMMLITIITTLSGCFVDVYTVYDAPIVDGKIHIGFEYKGDELPFNPEICSVAVKAPYDTSIPIDDVELDFSFGLNYELYEKEILEKVTSEFYEEVNKFNSPNFITPPYKLDEMQFIIFVCLDKQEGNFLSSDPSGHYFNTESIELPEMRRGFYYDEEDKTDGAAIIKSIPIQEMKKYQYRCERTKSITWFGSDEYNYEMTFNHSEIIKIPREFFNDTDRIELNITALLAYPETINGKTFYRMIDIYNPFFPYFNSDYPLGKVRLSMLVVDENVTFKEGDYGW